MSMWKMIVAALCAALWLVAPVSAQNASEPKDIVEQIYKISAGPNGKYEGNSAFFQDSVRKRWFSKSLLAAVVAADRKAKKSGDIGFDFDPVTNSQDPMVIGRKVSVEKSDAKGAVVLARFNSGGTNVNNIRYRFVREGEAWKLDDIAAGDWTIRGVVKEIMKGQ